MPSGLSGGDRWLLFGGGFVFFVIVVLTAFRTEDTQAVSTVPSIFSTGPAGARGAYLLLTESDDPVHVWEEPPSELPKISAGAEPLLILAEPTQIPTDTERKSLRAFVERGGTALFCGAKAMLFFDDPYVTPAAPSEKREEFSALIPSQLTRGAVRVNMHPQAYWHGADGGGAALYGDEDREVAGVWSIGKGHVIWWASATPLTNAGLRREDNLQLFLNATAGKEIYWDEYFHGAGASMFTHTAGTPVAWGALQLGLGTLLVLFTYARRRGPILAAANESRLSPLEFAGTMGGLYKRAGAAGIPVEICYRNLRLRLTRRLGLTASIPDADLADIAAQRLGVDGLTLASVLSRASAANIHTRDALPLVRELETFRKELR